MRVAVIGSRGLFVENLSPYLPAETTQIISGGAAGIDACAKAYAQKQGIPYMEFLPDYRRYGRGAPLRRNQQIIDSAEMVVALWDGESAGTKHVIRCCEQKQIPVRIYILTACNPVR